MTFRPSLHRHCPVWGSQLGPRAPYSLQSQAVHLPENGFPQNPDRQRSHFHPAVLPRHYCRRLLIHISLSHYSITFQNGKESPLFYETAEHHDLTEVTLSWRHSPVRWSHQLGAYGLALPLQSHGLQVSPTLSGLP